MVYLFLAGCSYIQKVLPTLSKLRYPFVLFDQMELNAPIFSQQKIKVVQEMLAQIQLLYLAKVYRPR